jgi:MYXO-CTERM domain-containing protein
MIPCTSCRRHLKLDERRCPFCGQTQGPRRQAPLLLLMAGLAMAPTRDEVRPMYGAPPADHARILSQLIDEGRYEEAVKKLEEGYLLSDNPSFLYNQGRVWEMAGERHKALSSYRRFHTECMRMKRNDCDRADERIAVLSRELAAAEASSDAAPQPDEPAAEPARSAEPSAQPQPAPAQAAPHPSQAGCGCSVEERPRAPWWIAAGLLFFLRRRSRRGGT